MKKLGIAAIVCAVTFLGLVIVGGICFGIGVADLAADTNIPDLIQTFGDDVFSAIESTHSYASYEGSESFDVNESCEAINLSGFAGEITILPHNDFNVTVEYSGLHDNIGTDGKHFEFDYDGQTLKIAPINNFTNQLSIGFFNIPDAGKITIYLPAYTDLYIPLELDLIVSDTVGEIDVNGFTFGDITLRNTIGEIEFTNVRAGMITCEDTIGEITAKGEFAGISVSDTIGECEITSTTALTLDSSIKGNIAEVQVNLPQGTQYYFTSSDIVGAVNIDNELKGGSDNVNFDVSGSIGNVIIEID